MQHTWGEPDSEAHVIPRPTETAALRRLAIIETYQERTRGRIALMPRHKQALFYDQAAMRRADLKTADERLAWIAVQCATTPERAQRRLIEAADILMLRELQGLPNEWLYKPVVCERRVKKFSRV